MVPEMQEIDDFFDRLDSNLDVIWGISTDPSLGQDAKVTILATGLEDGYGEAGAEPLDDVHDDSYYESLIPKLYKPIAKPVKEPAQEPPFTVGPALEPEPATPDPEPDREPTIIERLGRWANRLMQDTEE